MALALDPCANQILAALPDAELQRWLPGLEPVELSLGEVLSTPGAPSMQVLFPTTAIVSLLHLVDADAPAESAIVGREGMVGVSLFVGDQCIAGRAVVHSAGAAYRMKHHGPAEGFTRASMPQLMLRFTRALVTQMALTAVCNRQHSLERRLCRWLLLSLDRLPGNELLTPHALVAAMLGTQHEGVSRAASALQREGLLRCAPDRITVLDRKGLDRRACRCYAQVSRAYEHLRPQRAEP